MGSNGNHDVLTRGSLRPDPASEGEPHLRRREGSQLQNGVRFRGVVHPDRRFSGAGPPDGPPTVEIPNWPISGAEMPGLRISRRHPLGYQPP